jgi:hypothetical protein
LSHFPSPSAHLGIFSAAVKRQSKIHELSGGKPLLNFLPGQLTTFFSLRRRKIFAFHGLLGRLTELYVECRAFFNGKPNQNNWFHFSALDKPKCKFFKLSMISINDEYSHFRQYAHIQ